METRKLDRRSTEIFKVLLESQEIPEIPEA